jgi:hypothetical protein
MYLFRIRRRWYAIFIFIFIITSISTTELTRNIVFPLETIDVSYAADFLNSDGRYRWRYITLGFGIPSLSKLSILTNATTIDGGYPTARYRNVILSISGIESIDAAKFYGDGMRFLDYILKNKEDYNIRYVLVADSYYYNVLIDNGFVWIKDVYEGRRYSIWESSTPIPPIDINPHNPNSEQLESIIWGTIPISLFGTAIVFILYPIIYRFRVLRELLKTLLLFSKFR